MPDEAREVIFPKGIEVQMSKEIPDEKDSEQSSKRSKQSETAEEVRTRAEGTFTSESVELRRQAESSRSLGDNLVDEVKCCLKEIY